MDSTFIISERSGPIEIIRLNRPDKLNALSREMILALTDIFKRLERQVDLRAVILTGVGDKAFCAGTDIAELTEAADHEHRGEDRAAQDQGCTAQSEDRAPQSETRALGISERGQALCNQIENCGVPVIAAVNGIAAGGGCELALACHLRIAAAGAQFSLPETKVGVIPAYGGTQRLAREIGNGRALEMMLTGRAVGAEEALQFGLINRIAPAGKLLAQAESLANEISQLAPLAIRACLEAVNHGAELPLVEGLALEAKLFAELFATEDVREGTRAFLEKRRPVFRGK
jgi:enoyl-CoA hydratase